MIKFTLVNRVISKNTKDTSLENENDSRHILLGQTNISIINNKQTQNWALKTKLIVLKK